LLRPLKVTHWAPVKPVTVFPPASCAVMVTEKGVPAFGLDGVETANWAKEPVVTLNALLVADVSEPSVAFRA
jgi:hypothetical protein